jgi:hypothetical protein
MILLVKTKYMGYTGGKRRRKCLMTITYEGATEQVRQIVHHHAVLRTGVERRAGALCEAAQSGVPFQRQLAILRDYLEKRSCPMLRRRNELSTGRRPLRPAAATWSAR